MVVPSSPSPRYSIIEKMRLAGYAVGIYTGYYWWKLNAYDKGADMSYFSQLPLWEAWYIDKPDSVLIAPGWSSMMIWQSGTPAIGYEVGVESPTIDLDRWNDNYDFDNEWLAVVPPPIGGTMRYTATAISNGTRLRPNHNVNETYIASYSAGTKFDGDVLFIAPDESVPNQNAGDKWLEVKQVNGVAKAGWVAVTHLGQPVCTLVENIPTQNKPASIDMTLAAGSVVTIKDAGGAVLWTGTA